MNNTQSKGVAASRSAESLFSELIQAERRGDFKAARAIATELRTQHGWSCVKTAARKGVSQ